MRIRMRLEYSSDNATGNRITIIVGSGREQLLSLGPWPVYQTLGSRPAGDFSLSTELERLRSSTHGIEIEIRHGWGSVQFSGEECRVLKSETGLLMLGEFISLSSFLLSNSPSFFVCVHS